MARRATRRGTAGFLAILLALFLLGLVRRHGSADEPERAQPTSALTTRDR